MNDVEKIRNRMEIVAEKNNVTIFLDHIPLLESTKNSMCKWWYIQYDGEDSTHNMIQNFPDEYLHIFIDDIIEQLANGIDRNNLTMNIPKDIKKVRIGNKILEV